MCALPQLLRFSACTACGLLACVLLAALLSHITAEVAGVSRWQRFAIGMAGVSQRKAVGLGHVALIVALFSNVRLAATRCWCA